MGGQHLILENVNSTAGTVFVLCGLPASGAWHMPRLCLGVLGAQQTFVE